MHRRNVIKRDKKNDSNFSSHHRRKNRMKISRESPGGQLGQNRGAFRVGVEVFPGQQGRNWGHFVGADVKMNISHFLTFQMASFFHTHSLSFFPHISIFLRSLRYSFSRYTCPTWNHSCRHVHHKPLALHFLSVSSSTSTHAVFTWPLALKNMWCSFIQK